MVGQPSHSLAFKDRRHGIAVGGDFVTPTVAPDAAAVSRDGGRTWRTSAVVPGEYRSGAAWVAGSTALAVGPTGSDLTFDGGRTWTLFDTGSFDAVACAAHGACWASGEQGRVAVLQWGHGGRPRAVSRRRGCSGRPVAAGFFRALR